MAGHIAIQSIGQIGQVIDWHGREYMVFVVIEHQISDFGHDAPLAARRTAPFQNAFIY